MMSYVISIVVYALCLALALAALILSFVSPGDAGAMPMTALYAIVAALFFIAAGANKP